VIAAAGLAGALLLMIAGLTWSARLAHVGHLELRRRQTLQRVRGFLAAQDAMGAPLPDGLRHDPGTASGRAGLG
jgi:hypothetical protein